MWGVFSGIQLEWALGQACGTLGTVHNASPSCTGSSQSPGQISSPFGTSASDVVTKLELTCPGCWADVPGCEAREPGS